MLAVPFSRACSTRCYRSMVALHRSLVPVISWLSRPAFELHIAFRFMSFLLAMQR